MQTKRSRVAGLTLSCRSFFNVPSGLDAEAQPRSAQALGTFLRARRASHAGGARAALARAPPGQRLAGGRRRPGPAARDRAQPLFTAASSSAAIVAHRSGAHAPPPFLPLRPWRCRHCRLWQSRRCSASMHAILATILAQMAPGPAARGFRCDACWPLTGVTVSAARRQRGAGSDVGQHEHLLPSVAARAHALRRAALSGA